MKGGLFSLVEVCTLLSAFLVNHQLLQHFVHRYGNDVGAS